MSYVCDFCGKRIDDDSERRVPVDYVISTLCVNCAGNYDEVACDDCEGTGRDETDRTCSTCGGFGHVSA